MKSTLEIYALTVCFAAVVCLVITVGIAGYSVVRIVYPAITMNSQKYASHQTNDRFWQNWSLGKKDVARPPEQELTRQRQEDLQIELKVERREGVQTLLHTLMFFAVSAIALLLHSRIARKARALRR